MEESRNTDSFVAGSLPDLLYRLPAPKEVRAAAYQLLLTMPGVHAEGAGRDDLGRSGAVVSIDQPQATGPKAKAGKHREEADRRRRPRGPAVGQVRGYAAGREQYRSHPADRLDERRAGGARSARVSLFERQPVAGPLSARRSYLNARSIYAQLDIFGRSWCTCPSTAALSACATPCWAPSRRYPPISSAP
ncbi:hypothetical protein [Nonomuraea sp. KM90]|uniref:hypothetical protein n=1 Tax=Nonomuraea sp. KM90 TaxID=3457428 RepID=UPI003FCE925B